MSALEQLPFRALTANQQSVLAVMEVDLYRRRHLPRMALPAGSPAVIWSDADCLSPLARAVAHAAGTMEVARWCRDWLAAGKALPDLAQLRASPAAKRALWQLLRADARR